MMSDDTEKKQPKQAAKKPKKISITDADDKYTQDSQPSTKEDTKNKGISIKDFADSPEGEDQDLKTEQSENTASLESSTENVDEFKNPKEKDTSDNVDKLDSVLDDKTENLSDGTLDQIDSESDREHQIEELEHRAEDIAETEKELHEESDKTIEEAMRDADLRDEHDVFDPDPEVDKAVDAIVRAEGDTAFEAEDEKLHMPVAKTRKEKIKQFFVAWWHNHYARYGTLAALIVLFGAIALIPVTRYAVLNTVGVRVQASVTVVDEQTRLPLKNIAVSIQGKAISTDEKGTVNFSGLKLGSSELLIAKRGYADIDTKIVLGWGSNPLGARSITATGEQYKFALTDWLTENPISENAEAVAGENSASADESGVITLTIGEENLSEVEIVVSADNYRSETYSIADLDGEVTKVSMVTSRKHAFISNRDGKYDLYSIDLDGKNEKIIVEATEKERDVPALLHHPTRNIAGFISSRSGETNGDGFKLDELYIVNTESGDLRKVARSEQLRLIGWVDDTVLFSQVVEGTSAGNPERSKIISYNERTKEREELASANYFNDVELVNDTLYYAVSSFAVPQSKAKLYSVPAKGGDNEVVLDRQVWNLFRVAYDTIQISAIDQKWYELKNDTVEPIDIQPAPFSREFLDNIAGDYSAWVEVRDGKGTILTLEFSTQEEKVVFATPGLSELLYWTNDSTLVYRVTSSSETADYVLPFENGDAIPTPIKIRDVTANQRYQY